jgi:magnesium-transporting ATPase (P-type)
MGKTNWKRVFLGGLIAGVVLNIINFVALAIYLRNLWNPVLESLNPAFQETTAFQVFWILFQLVSGFLAVWLYSAIRPRYGAGPKTAVIAGLAVWVLQGLSFEAILGAFGLFPSKVLIIDAITILVASVISTLVGAWAYKEE